MKAKGVSIIFATCLFAGCVAPPERESQANEAELLAIRVVPASQVTQCEFIVQANILQGQSFFGGQAELAGNAETRMKKKALSAGADTMVVTDRIYDDGGGTGKQPTLSLFADLYRCKSVAKSDHVRPEPDSPSPRAEAVADSSKSDFVPVSKKMLLEVQSKLKEMGYYAGEIDGIYGRVTAKALSDFQKDRNLPVSGVADSSTLDELGLDE